MPAALMELLQQRESQYVHLNKAVSNILSVLFHTFDIYTSYPVNLYTCGLAISLLRTFFFPGASPVLK